jgi:hypothetical protein
MCQVRCKCPILLCAVRVANPLLEVVHVISGIYVVWLLVVIGKWVLLSGAGMR